MVNAIAFGNNLLCSIVLIEEKKNAKKNLYPTVDCYGNTYLFDDGLQPPVK